MRLLEQHPEIARDSLFTAIVCGELAEVQTLLSRQPAAATQPGGPKGWEPLLYLCFARLPLPAVEAHALTIARTLLDHGADPNASFEGGGCRYSALVGVIGEGEEHRPPHPSREALTRLLLERGAEPYDMQVLYNIHFRGDLLWLIALIHEHAVRNARQADWDDPQWPMLDMGGYGSGARYLLGIALRRNDLTLAEWLLEHGADPNVPPPRHPEGEGSLHDEARRLGFGEMAELLRRHGAAAGDTPYGERAAFAAACFRGDRAEAEALLAAHPEFLHARAPSSPRLRSTGRMSSSCSSIWGCRPTARIPSKADNAPCTPPPIMTLPRPRRC